MAPEIHFGISAENKAPNLVASALAHYQRHIGAYLRAAAHPIEGVLDAIVRDFGLQDQFCHVISTSGSDDPARQKRSGYH
jgi:hypothetical protein